MIGERFGPAFALLLVLALLLLLTAAALWWPRAGSGDSDGTLLVLSPAADPRREEALAALARYVGDAAGQRLRLEVARDRAAFAAGLSSAAFVLTPDAVAVTLPAAAWQPLAAGRRRVPWNLRPSAVLISRVDAAGGDRPWQTAPDRTAVGDSLSLVCLAPLCADGRDGGLPAGVTWGDDPYDHRALFLAARHGAFDHVLGRQWDLEALLAAGRLDGDRWRVRTVSDPVPDLVIMVNRRVPMPSRLAVQQALSVLGRQEQPAFAGAAILAVQLGRLGLDGFNALLGPDFDRLRRRFGPCWPRLAP